MNRETNYIHNNNMGHGSAALAHGLAALALVFGAATTTPVDAKTSAAPKKAKAAQLHSGAPGKFAKAPKAPAEPAQCYAEYVAYADTGETLHAINPDAPILPASVAKTPLGLLVADAVAAGRTTLDRLIEVPKPPIVGQGKKRRAASIHATLCDAGQIGQDGTITMTVLDALRNTLIASNLFTSIGLKNHLEGITGRSYASLAAEKLNLLGNTRSVLIEPVGLSNAGACANETSTPKQYAERLKALVDAGTPLSNLNQNISTVREMTEWTRAAMKVPGITTSWHEREVTFDGRTLRATNSLLGKDIEGKTGTTKLAGTVFAGSMGIHEMRPLTVSVAACPSRTRAARIDFLQRTFAPQARGTLPLAAPLANFPQISDSQRTSAPIGMTP